MPLSSLAFDPRSVIVLAGLMGLIMSLVLFFMRRSYPASIRGLREWTLGPLACFGSTVLFALRDVLPGFFTIVLANMLLFHGCLLYYVGSQRFLGRPSTLRRWNLFTLVLGAVMFWFMAVSPNYPARLAVFTAAVSVLFMVHARLYLRHGVTNFGMRFMTGLLLLQAAVAAARLVTVLLGAAGLGLMEASWIQSLYIAMYSLTALLLSIAGIVMATDRVREEFEFLATHDPLTGVMNRRALIDATAAEHARCRRAGGAMTLLMLDVDHFKGVNDGFGHQTGDEVLRDLALRLQGALGSAGLLGRYGGEESWCCCR